MDYEKLYQDAIEKLQEALAPKNGCEISGLTRNCLEEIFPELKENEDERIRKDITILVNDWWDRVATDNISSREEMLAWLEKQSEKGGDE